MHSTQKKAAAATKCLNIIVVTQKLVFVAAWRRKRAGSFLNWEPLLSLHWNLNNRTTTSLTEKSLCFHTYIINLCSLLLRYGESSIQTALKKRMVVSLAVFGFPIDKKPATFCHFLAYIPGTSSRQSFHAVVIFVEKFLKNNFYQILNMVESANKSRSTRVQLTQATSFVVNSQIYGSSFDASVNLRSLTNSWNTTHQAMPKT